jgi:hypothetical protein
MHDKLSLINKGWVTQNAMPQLIETVTALDFISRKKNGKTRPSVVGCRRADGSFIEVILKLSKGCEREETDLAIEVVASILAGDLSLPIPTPYIVEFEDAFAQAIPDLEIKNLALSSSKIAFGSKNLGSGYRSWTDGDQISNDNLQRAAGVFAFDAIIQNPDRKSDNPNCLTLGSEFRIFDHEVAFRHKLILFWQAPWVIGGLENLRSPGAHIFRAGLVKLAPDFSPIRDAWAGLTDERLATYVASIPQAWASAGKAVQDAVDLIREARDRIDACLDEVRRILS